MHACELYVWSSSVALALEIYLSRYLSMIGKQALEINRKEILEQHKQTPRLPFF